MSTNRLNVLFLPKWYPNKFDPFDGNFIENHAHAIQRFCNVFVLFVHSDENCNSLYEVLEKDNKGIQEISVYFKKPKTGISILDRIFTALRYRKAQRMGFQKLNVKIDLCHLHVLSRSSPLALTLKKNQSIPFMISEHWSGYHKEVGSYKGFLKKWYTEKVVKNAAQTHTVSTPLKQSMLAHHLQSQYTVIPNVVDTDLFIPRAKSNKNTEVLFVGNLLQEPKRILDIIRQFALIAQERSNVRLSIYGEGKEESQCRDLIRELKLENVVRLMGVRKRNEIAEIMSQSDFLILFSDYENQPCVINEAMACGIPVLVPDIGGISELMREDLGILFPTGNEKAFHDGLLQMIDTHKEYSSSTIREFALQNFSEEEIGKKFLNMYNNILKVEQ